MIEWFKTLVKDLPKEAPVDIELFYISIKLNERDYYEFSKEVAKYEENNGGITRSYNGNSNQDYIEIQIGSSYFTVYKKQFKEDRVHS